MSSEPDRNVLRCNGNFCRTRPGNLPEGVDQSVFWKPCGDAAFEYSGSIRLDESGGDSLSVGPDSWTGVKKIEGRASGAVIVRLRTHPGHGISGGVDSLQAKCASPQPESPVYLDCSNDKRLCTTPSKGEIAANTVATAAWDPCNGGSFEYSGHINMQAEANTDFLELSSERSAAQVTFFGDRDIDGAFDGPVKLRLVTDATGASMGITRDLLATCVAEPFLKCEGLTCRSRASALPNNLQTEVTWDPCGGQSFEYSAQISGEGDEFIGVGPNRHPATEGNIRGSAAGTVKVVAHSNGQNPSLRLNSLQATCTGNAALVCSGKRCVTPQETLPRNFSVDVLWDPCNGGPFRFEGQIDMEDNRRDELWVGGYYYKFNDQLRNQVTGPVVVRINTGLSGVSAGIRSLEATCLSDVHRADLYRPTMSSWTPQQAQQFSDTVRRFFAHRGQGQDPYGRGLFRRHMSWHIGMGMMRPPNGEGGRQGRGSGIAFLAFHRVVQEQFKAFVREHGGLEPLPINIDAALPEGLANSRAGVQAVLSHGPWPPGMEEPTVENRVSNSFLTRDSRYTGASIDDEQHHVGIPPWLTLEGRGYDARWGTFRYIEGHFVQRLGDVRTPDELGRLFGRSRFNRDDEQDPGGRQLLTSQQVDNDGGRVEYSMSYHGAGHAKIGGNMGGHSSPTDPVFWGWHEHVDQILNRWLELTENGRRWRAANPNHPLFAIQRTMDLQLLEGWERSNFRERPDNVDRRPGDGNGEWSEGMNPPAP